MPEAIFVQGAGVYYRDFEIKQAAKTIEDDILTPKGSFEHVS